MITKLASLNFNNDMALSIILDQYIIDINTGKEYKVNQDCRAFLPGEVDAVKLYTGLTDTDADLIYIKSKWTPEVIANYQAILAQNTLNNI